MTQVGTARRATTDGRGGWRRRGAAAVAAGGVLAAGWWWTHPGLLGDGTMSGGSLEIGARAVEENVVHVGIAVPPVRGDGEERLVLGSAAATFSENSSATRAAFSVCVPKPGANPIGAVSEPLAVHCSEVRPVADGTLLRWVDGFPSGEYLVMTLTPTRPGSAHVDAVTFTYSRSWRHLRQTGTDRTEVDIRVRST